ncbi:MAG: penicillin-binding transpeptidase domain-containing protein [Rhabdochlamydiaceae bacterium]|nr:penicillin-binding transpeptidase domain-containing protein [Candidatus Amphrikana amoebophyrae]
MTRKNLVENNHRSDHGEMIKEDISRKANRLLMGILIIFLLIGVKILLLTTVQHSHFVEQSKKPQYKTIIEKANRGTIRDRYNITLASNHLQYNASIIFDEIRTLPKVKYKKQNGKKTKIYVRKRYIENLSKLLGKKLHVDPLFVEDTIYAKASIFPNTPFVLKEGISEKLYYELRSLERNWPGLKAQISSHRNYPLGKVGCNILGYMGAINKYEHDRVFHQIDKLQEFITEREEGLPTPLPSGFDNIESVYHKLHELKEKSYSINAKVGKSGIEKTFDNDLRGFYGKKKFEVNTKGHIIRELPDSFNSTPGRRFLLNISAELQEFAERLLTTSEEKREKRFRIAGKHHNLIHPPYIKGGSIVAMVPKTGEIVAMASYPRFDPSDFVYSGDEDIKLEKQMQINKWLETPTYISYIWDGKKPLEREYFSLAKGGYWTQSQWLTLETYLDMILSKESTVKVAIEQVKSLSDAILIENDCSELIQLTDDSELFTLINLLYPAHKSHLQSDLLTIQYTQDKLNGSPQKVALIKSRLDPYLSQIEHNDDKLLFLDLIHLLAPTELKNLPHEILAQYTLSEYRELTQSFSQIENHLKAKIAKHFHSTIFLDWRNSEFKDYLKSKRQEEKEAKKYQKPYIEYLEKKEKELFSSFYQEHKWTFTSLFLSINQQLDNSILSFAPICRKAGMEAYSQIRGISNLRSALHKLSSEHSLLLCRSFKKMSDLSIPLFGHYHLRNSKRKDQTQKQLAMHFYPITGFGYSRSYAFQEAAPLGSIFKIVTAFEATNQKFSPNTPNNLNPLTIIDCSNPKTKERSKQILGYHTDGKKITRRYKGGRLPASYKKAGKIDLLKAFELSSNIYFSLLASDKMNKPTDLTNISSKMNFGKKTGIDLPGEIRGILPTDIIDNQTGLYAFAIGQHSLVVSPLQTAVMMSSIANSGQVLKPQIVKLTASIENSNSRNLSHKKYPFKEYINLVGLDFPFFSETVEQDKKKLAKKVKPHILHQLTYPPQVKSYILKGLHNVVNGERGSARPNAIHSLYESYQDKKNYVQMKQSMVGKTATAEILYRPCLDRQFKPIICKHIWFSSASFETDKTTNKPNFEEPELVCIVYLRFGDFGKEAAPIASKIIQKYREITRQKKNSRVHF